jgi:hypothetical protein
MATIDSIYITFPRTVIIMRGCQANQCFTTVRTPIAGLPVRQDLRLFLIFDISFQFSLNRQGLKIIRSDIVGFHEQRIRALQGELSAPSPGRALARGIKEIFLGTNLRVFDFV